MYMIYTLQQKLSTTLYIYEFLTINFKIVGPLLKNVNHLIIFSKVQKSAWIEYK